MTAKELKEIFANGFYMLNFLTEPNFLVFVQPILSFVAIRLLMMHSSQKIYCPHEAPN